MVGGVEHRRKEEAFAVNPREIKLVLRKLLQEEASRPHSEVDEGTVRAQRVDVLVPSPTEMGTHICQALLQRSNSRTTQSYELR